MMIIFMMACFKSAGPAPAVETRIVAIGPAISEVVHALRPTALVGVDDASHEHAALADKPTIGFSRAISAEGVLSLGPTHVLLTDRAGPPEAVEQMRSAGVTVVELAQERTVEGVRSLIVEVGQAIDRDPTEVLATFDATCTTLPQPTGRRALFLYARGPDAVSVSGAGTAGAAMLGLAGLKNAHTSTEGYKPLTPEAVVSVDPDVVVFTTKGLEALGGREGLGNVPGLSVSRAVREGNVAHVDDLDLLAFGLGTCKGASALGAMVR